MSIVCRIPTFDTRVSIGASLIMIQGGCLGAVVTLTVRSSHRQRAKTTRTDADATVWRKCGVPTRRGVTLASMCWQVENEKHSIDRSLLAVYRAHQCKSLKPNCVAAKSEVRVSYRSTSWRCERTSFDSLHIVKGLKPWFFHQMSEA